MKLNRNNGLSLVEVVVAGVIFIIATVGTFSVLANTRRQSAFSDRRLQAAYYSRQLFDELRAKVAQDSWGNWYLICNADWNPWPDNMTGTGNPFFDNFNGRALYNCIDNPPEVGAVTGVRKVTLNVVWDEP